MTSRAAILIAAPGDPGEENYAKGALVDVINYRNYLVSPLGGSWKNSEIVTLRDPSKVELEGRLKFLRSVDYSFLFFAGHGGYYPTPDKTMVDVSNGVIMAESELAWGAKRHTLLLDCCRKIPKHLRRLEKAIVLEDYAGALNPSACRQAFDNHVQSCGIGTITLFGCSIGQEAVDDDQQGGLYASSMLRVARDWAQQQKNATSSALSVIGAHMKAQVRVEAERREQIPAVKKPRTGPYFPFAVAAT